LGRWLRAASKVSGMGKGKRIGGDVPSASTPEREIHSTRERTPVEKLRAVTAAFQLKDAELGAFLRREGIHLAQLEEWRTDVLTALGNPAPRPKDPDIKRVRELERELARKDKALAEVTALLVLEKKVQALFGTSAEEGDSTDERYEKK
jgi:transposase